MSTIGYHTQDYQHTRRKLSDIPDSSLLFSSFDDPKPFEILCGTESSDEHRLSSIKTKAKLYYL
jgi:hypothetical protein